MTVDVFSVVFAGALVGFVLGMESVRFIETLFYQVKATHPTMLMLPTLTILVAALLGRTPARDPRDAN